MGWSPGAKARAAERMRALNADPEFKAKSAERMRALNADPEFKAKISKASAERMRALNADPEFKAKMLAVRRGVEVPGWVERAGLAEDYVSIAKETDEIDAAAHCRRLLREMKR